MADTAIKWCRCPKRKRGPKWMQRQMKENPNTIIRAFFLASHRINKCAWCNRPLEERADKPGWQQPQEPQT